jgi:hypothetical protein
MNRRAVLFGFVVAIPLAAIAVACTFPEITFTGADGGASSGTNPGSDGSSGSTSGSSTGGLSDSGAEDKDANSIAHDSGTVVSPGNCIPGAAKCDCDNDGWGDKACMIDAGPNGYDGGLKQYDCDDNLGARYPDAGFNDSLWPAGATGTPFDWNCDGQVEYFYDRVECQSTTLGCAASPDGYVSNSLPCAAPHDIYNCPAVTVGTCNYASTGHQATQACK